MAHQSSNQKQLPPSPTIDLRSTVHEPYSPSEILDIKSNSPWFTREETHVPLVPIIKKNPNMKPLFQGTTLLRKFIVDDNPKTETDPLNVLTVPTGPDAMKHSILKTTKPHIIKLQKSVTIADELKDNSPSLSTDSKGGQTILIPAKEPAKAKRGFLDKFKDFLPKIKKPVNTAPKVNQTKDLSLEPQLEQLKFLNSNLNAWESDQERLSRLKARHRKSLKGLTVRRKTSLKRMPSNTFMSSWNAMKANMIQNIKRNKLVLPPDGRTRMTWDLLGMLFILYEVIMIPIKISFTFDDSIFIAQLEWMIDVFFLIDILLTFNTGYYFRGNLVIARRKIAINYLQTWFAFDLIASIPYNRIVDAADGIDETGASWLGQSARIMRILRFFRFIRVLRLLRVFKLQSIFGKLESFISLSPALNTSVGFLRLSAIILFIAHWIACFWHLIGDIESTDVADTWITRQEMQDASWSSKYLTSIYWAVTTMITVGYGDIFPVTDSEKIYTLFAMLVASVVFAYSMNSISALLTSLDLENEEYKKTIVWVQRYMKQMKLDRETRMKVKKYLEYTMNEVTFRKDDETKLLGLLSDSLKDELIKKINKGALENCQPLEKLLKKTFSERFITEMIYFLQERIYSPSEIIFTEENDVECSIYMVSMGMIDICLFGCNDLKIETLKKGEHFGELEFFTGMKRQWGAKASGEFVSLFYLKRRDLLDLLDSFSTEKERFFQTKDKISLFGDYTAIDLKCSLCKGVGHSAIQCPMMHYVVDKEKFLQEQIKEMYKFRTSFIRRNRRKWKHRNDKLLEPTAAKIREHLSSFIEAAENEANDPRAINVTSFGEDLTRRHNEHTPTSGGGHRKSFMGFKSITESLDGEDSHHELQPRERYHRGVKAKNQPKKPSKTNPFETGIDAVCSYRDYFPHNNVDSVIEKINEKIRKEKKMRRMKAIRKVIAFTSIRKKLGANKIEKPKTPAAAHDYGIGKIKFLSANSKYEETLFDSDANNEHEAETRKRTPTVEEEQENEDAGVKIAEEGVKFNKKFCKESKEFNKQMEFKLLQDIRSPDIDGFDLAFMNPESPKIRINLAEERKEADFQMESKDVEIKTDVAENENYDMMTQAEVNRLLQHVIEKYGSGYVKKIINETDNR